MNEELIEKVNNYLTKQFICELGYLPEDECETEAKYLITLISAEAYEKGYNTAVEHCAESIAEARKQERELLQKAVKLIKIWHNGEAVMKLGREKAAYMWNIYYNNAPEMKEIRQALKEGGKEAE